MDADRFDTIARALNSASTRRAVLGGGVGGLLVGLFGRDDAEAGKGRKGKGKSKGKGKKRGNTTRPAPLCANGIQDGAETDVDCGGSCPRCAAGKTCASRNDCQSALCTGGACEQCSGSTCGSDGDGFCFCDQPAAGGAMICDKEDATAGVTNCAMCPPDTTCIGFGDSFTCYRRCGAP